MRKRYGGQSSAQARAVELRDTPASDLEFARIVRHREAGTSPGNPKWYKFPTIRQFIFKAGLPAKLPSLPAPGYVIPQVLKFPHWDDTVDLGQYVREFETLNGLKHHPTDWRKIPDGSYA